MVTSRSACSVTVSVGLQGPRPGMLAYSARPPACPPVYLTVPLWLSTHCLCPPAHPPSLSRPVRPSPSPAPNHPCLSVYSTVPVCLAHHPCPTVYSTVQSVYLFTVYVPVRCTLFPRPPVRLPSLSAGILDPPSLPAHPPSLSACVFDCPGKPMYAVTVRSLCTIQYPSPPMYSAVLVCL